MPEIIDILTLTPSTQEKFTVNTAADYVVPTFPAGFPYPLKNANGKDTFLNGDNFSILSAGLVLPECFTPWKDPADLGIYGLPTSNLIIIGNSGDFYRLDVMGTSNLIYIPMECFELNIDVFAACKNQENIMHPGTFLNENFHLATDNASPLKISMKGIPAAFNGKTFSIQPFFKILHNFKLI